MRLIFTAGLKSLGSNLFRTILTVLGIALGVTTVATIITLDINTHLSELRRISHITKWGIEPEESDVQIISLNKLSEKPGGNAKSTENILEEDYQIMRSAVRLASLLSFFIGAIIVYYTIGFSIQQRKKELALLTALGTTFSQIVLIVLFEATVLGVVGSALGIGGSWPLFRILKHFGVTTTGRGILLTNYIPIFEFLVVMLLGTLTVLLGAIQPILKLRNFSVSNALQPRYLSDGSERLWQQSSNLFSLIIPILSMTYILMRPFFKEFIPSIVFYIGELGFIVGMFLLVVFFIPRVISYIIKLLGRIWLNLFPLEVKLTYSRFTHFTPLISWPISNIMLVFAFLLTLHLVTKSLKEETLAWGQKAAEGLVFSESNKTNRAFPERKLRRLKEKYTYVRLSLGTPVPNRIVTIEKSELEKYKERAPELRETIDCFDAESLIMSYTMAQQLRVKVDDLILVKSPRGEKKLKVIGITDKLGFYPENKSYRERKSFALIEQQNDFLLRPEDAMPGLRLVIWNKKNPRHHVFDYAELVELFHILDRPVSSGVGKVNDQVREINKDFFIFDVVLFLATMLAALGVTNTMLIQLQARRREIALLQVLGMSSFQILKMVLIEGLFIGKIGGVLAILLGIPLAWASIEALSVLSVFNVALTLSFKQLGGIFMGAIFVTLISALYPAFIGFQLKTGESIHYE